MDELGFERYTGFRGKVANRRPAREACKSIAYCILEQFQINEANEAQDAFSIISLISEDHLDSELV